MAGIIWQSHVIWFHFIQETRVYNVEDDVTGYIHLTRRQLVKLTTM